MTTTETLKTKILDAYRSQCTKYDANSIEYTLPQIMSSVINKTYPYLFDKNMAEKHLEHGLNTLLMKKPKPNNYFTITNLLNDNVLQNSKMNQSKAKQLVNEAFDECIDMDIKALRSDKRELEINIQTRNCSWKCVIKSQICLNLIQLYHSWILQHQYSIKIIQCIIEYIFYHRNIVVEYSQPNTHKTLNVGHMRNDCELYNLDNVSNFSQTTIDNHVSALTLNDKMQVITTQQTRDEFHPLLQFSPLKIPEIIEFKWNISDFTYTFENSTEPPSSLSDFVDSTQMNGQIKCTISLSSDLQIKVTHNFYTQITMITQVKMEGYHPMDVSIVNLESNKCMFAFNIELNDNEIKTQWIEIKVKYNKNFKYSFDIRTVITKIMSKSFEFCGDESEFITDEISPKYHNIRQYVFAQTVMDLYNLYFSKDVLSIIFDEYYPNYFDLYGEPFIYDSLDLNNANNILNRLRKSYPIDDNDVTETFIMTNNKKTICNVNGIGIQLSLNEKYVFSNHFLREYDIDATNLTAIWPMNTSSLSKLKKLQKVLREYEFTRVSAAVKAELLLDANIFKTQEYMLWIKWDKTYTKQESTRIRTDLCNYSFDTHYINDRDDRACIYPHYNYSSVICWITPSIVTELCMTETQDDERIAQIRSCKKQCKRLYNAKFNKYKKYKHNNKYRYHRW